MLTRPCPAALLGDTAEVHFRFLWLPMRCCINVIRETSLQITVNGRSLVNVQLPSLRELLTWRAEEPFQSGTSMILNRLLYALHVHDVLNC